MPMSNSPGQSGALGIQELSTFTAVLPLPVAAERRKGIPRDESAQRSIYCHTEFTDCFQHGRHSPPTLLFLQPYKHWPGFV